MNRNLRKFFIRLNELNIQYIERTFIADYKKANKGKHPSLELVKQTVHFKLAQAKKDLDEYDAVKALNRESSLPQPSSTG